MALLVVSAALFATGALIEHNSGKTGERPGQAAQQREQDGPGEGSEGRAADGHDEQTEQNGQTGSGVPEDAGQADQERLLGLPAESPLTVGGAVIVALLLAGAAWRRPIPVVIAATGLFAAAAAVFDIAETAHQINEGRGGIAALAALVAVLHLAITVAATAWATVSRAHAGAEMR